jgi:hypothetical protein
LEVTVTSQVTVTWADGLEKYSINGVVRRKPTESFARSSIIWLQPDSIHGPADVNLRLEPGLFSVTGSGQQEKQRDKKKKSGA